MAGAAPVRQRRWVSVPLAFALVCGASTSLQAFINGRLGRQLDSAELAAAIAVAVGWMALAALSIATGALGRARRAVPRGSRFRAWWLLAGANGALFVTVGAAGAAKVGVALLTVALVCGQSLGGLVTDHVGLSTAGQRPITRYRVAGVVVAIVAVIVGALGAPGHLRLGLLALAVLTGALLTVQQASLSQMARVTGEPLVAAWINTSAGLVVMGAVVVAVLAGSSPDVSSPSLGYVLAPGLIGIAFLIMMTIVVRILGILRLTLAVVAGQAVGALGVDLVWPAPGKAVTVGTVVGVALTLVAVAVSGGRATLGRDAPTVG